MGYYSRAARLLSGAQKAVKELHGRLPDNAKDMEAKIPGVGRYSAGAISSIAYNHCVPVVGYFYPEPPYCSVSMVLSLMAMYTDSLVVLQHCMHSPNPNEP